MKILITGSAGFIGSALSLYLLKRGDVVTGVDNHNNYYDPKLKNSRVKRLSGFKKYSHFKLDISNNLKLKKIFNKFRPDKVINLAAQVGVRNSISNPNAYISSNINGFMNILENCKTFQVNELIYASSSSVYGNNFKTPFSEKDRTSEPLSIYAASKLSNELMSYVYSKTFNLKTIGLRFFTVYGPWGRPDMALFKFTKAIYEGKTIEIYNKGNHYRDFTYIDDIINGIVKLLDDNKIKQKKKVRNKNSSNYEIFNIGNSKPIKLLKYVSLLESTIGKKVKKKYLPLQKGDMIKTYAYIGKLKKKVNYKPQTSINEGIKKFVDWYKDYYKV